MENKNATFINESIEKVLQACEEETSYDRNHRCIREAFAGHPDACNREITQDDIYRQLALVDTFYSTNARMRRFGLDELAEAIWGACGSANGNSHTLGILSGKLAANQPLNPEIKELFTSRYGYLNGKRVGKSPSLLSKYFYFVAIVCARDDWGFPIYDSIVCDLLNPLERFLGLFPLSPKKQLYQSNALFDIDVYREGLKRVIDVLEANNPTLWKTSGKQKYDLLDYFLWHIGKAEKNSSSLLTKTEESHALLKPQQITDWINICAKIKTC